MNLVSRKAFFLLYFLIQILHACSPVKKLKEGQYLLYSQTVKGNKKLSKSEFTDLYKEKTNTKIFGLIPLVSMYNGGSSFFDSSKVRRRIEKAKDKYDGKIEGSKDKEQKKERLKKQESRKITKLNTKLKKGNFLMKLGEPPAIYDSSLINKTLALMQYHLLSKGFMEGTVTTQTDSSDKKVNVIYNINEGPEFIIENLYYKVEDKKADSLVRANLKQSSLQEKKRYEEADLTAERNRLSSLLRNNGYFDFSPGYIYFNIDTLKEKAKISLQTVILNPPGKAAHPIYTIDTVYFITNENIVDSANIRDTTFHNGIYYVSNKELLFSKKIADRKIKIHQGDIFKQKEIEHTQKNLSGLDMYRTVNIQYLQDSLRNKLTAVIRAQTLRKFQILNEAGLNVNQGMVPGPFLSINYKERNAFKGFEIWEINLRAAITGQAAVLNPTSILRTEEYSALTSLSFPQLYLPGLRGKQWENYNPRTKIVGGYTITKRPEYERATAKSGLVYSVSPDKFRQIIFSPIDINLINTARISDTFNLYLKYLQQRGNNLIYGFRSSFVSDINASYIFNNNDPVKNNKSRYLKYYMESGGTIFNLIPRETVFGLQTFKYIRMNADIRYYFPVSKKNTFAMKFNIGIANPYGNNHGLPYEKYFFAGGPNSIRAWKLRRLGPGSFAQTDSTTGERNYRIEQPGEMLLETSYEYRFKIVSIFEGALFIDAGNVWMLTKDPARPGAQFKTSTFLSQIAVGTGAGLRLNFSFLILRLDLGIKAYDPAVKKFILTTTALKQTTINFGIGYPF
jgi:outer membrane protein insertion porin family